VRVLKWTPACAVFHAKAFPFRGTSAPELAFIAHHKKEMTMDNSNGAPGAATTPADSARRVKEAATNVIDRGREAAMTKVQETVNHGAERARTTVQSTSGALRRAADDLQDENAWIGTGLRKAADWLEQTTDQIGQGDINQVVDNLNSFARRQPALFLGASLAAGFVIARFGKTALEGVSRREFGSPDREYNSGLTTDGTPGL
jgi:hypothetical protein